MGVFVVPGSYTEEEDFSLYALALSSSICAMPIVSPKGESFKPTLTSVTDMLINTFFGDNGQPILSAINQDFFSALAFLEKGNMLYCIRVVPDDATKASAVLKDSGGADVLKVEAIGEGSYYNRIVVTVSSINEDYYKVLISLDKSDNVVEVINWKTSKYPEAKEFIQNTRSKYVKFKVLSTNNPAPATVKLTGGSDGGKVTAGNVMKAIDTVANPNEIDINIITAPGWTEPEVINKCLSVCESRGDCMSIHCTPQGMTPQEAVEWHNGNGGAFQAFNSSYGAMYYGWLKVYDRWRDREIWVPPEGFVAGVYAYTDKVADPWFAPAGLNRGKLVTPLNVEYNPTEGEMELMYGNQNALNPIVRFKKDGIAIWGQKTLQRKPSALDRVNVRRLLLYIRKVIATSTKYLVFEPNDPFTWRQWKGLVDPFLEDIKRRRGIYAFQTICDETTNTPERIDKYLMYGKALIKPTKAAEIVVSEFGILRTGAEFNEYVQ
ncbi:hypothetical protein SAMN06269117_11314 [Balnearium lithotrophicum]|uniref:Phage tail sheath protein n=1 Tax=Balnearium lithotrophicum TaxID=223788 RepID=A0A521CKY5_9BACT|nr:phage tail sheath C-terminal domain-containing protein [Balnearium lithotrophicum]SMO59381.1 hypothetical protein SAMN06269117_11314 [Balnearium lithotrophicum]